MKCPKHMEVGEFEGECPICSDPVDFWPIADWDNPTLRSAVSKLPKPKKKVLPQRSPSLKHPITW